jgi:RHS repeat-associated protein
VVEQSGTLASVNPYRFSTKYTDPETGLVMYPARPYSPTLGRYASRDPLLDEVSLLRFLAKQPRAKRYQLRTQLMLLPAYRFVENNPISYVDPDGQFHWSIPVVGGILVGGAWAICCELHMGEIARDANAIVSGVMTGWPPGYSTGAEGTPADALQHCIGACMANQDPGICTAPIARAGINWSDRGEPNDLANNGVGFGITGDCQANCLQALRDGRLTCGGTSATDPSYPCPAPPGTPPPPPPAP